MSNKYQYGDLISNDDAVFDVHIVGDAIQVIYPQQVNQDLSWIGGYLNERGYELRNSVSMNGAFAKDIFGPEDSEDEEQEQESETNTENDENAIVVAEP